MLITCAAQLGAAHQQMGGTCSSQQQRSAQAAPPAPLQRRRQLLVGVGAAAAAVLAGAGGRPLPAAATGLESIDLPPIETPEIVSQIKARNQAVLDAAEESFQNSDLLRTLKERSDANRDARKRELQDRYCMRQAELGVGDCGGLRYIPGMTKSGVQRRPEWLENLFGGSDE